MFIFNLLVDVQRLAWHLLAVHQVLMVVGLFRWNLSEGPAQISLLS